MIKIQKKCNIFAKLFVPGLKVNFNLTKFSPKPHGYSVQAMLAEGIQSIIFYV